MSYTALFIDGPLDGELRALEKLDYFFRVAEIRDFKAGYIKEDNVIALPEIDKFTYALKNVDLLGVIIAVYVPHDSDIDVRDFRMRVASRILSNDAKAAVVRTR